MLMFKNFDLDNIITPIKASTLKNILDECGYDKSKTNQLYHGFQEGFTLGYEGDPHVKLTAPNLKFRIGSELELWNKVMKEVQAKRYAGPFKERLNLRMVSYNHQLDWYPKIGANKLNLFSICHIHATVTKIYPSMQIQTSSYVLYVTQISQKPFNCA